MAKRSNNNSTGRRAYGEKPYDVNNSFVKKVATKVTDLIPQRSWISKWFNSPGGRDDASTEPENAEDQDVEEEALQPPSKRPRIRMDMTHPPGTFSIQSRNRRSREEYPLQNETLDFLHPPTTSNARSFVASTPAIRVDVNNTVRSNLHNNLHQRQNNLPTNGADDNSESSESTSGCSSLIPQANRADVSFVTRKGLEEKMSFTNHLQSPRSLFLDGRESMSSRRPCFNASIVQNNDTERSILSSPFYSGNTTFGGSNSISNFRRGIGQSSDFQLKVPRRASIRVKPSNTPAVADSTGMSQTAKRILEALEHFSSPITDAKKIPMKSPMNTFVAKKRPREEDLPPTSRVGLRHLTRELAIPTVPDMLKLKRRQRLQDTTLAARRIVSANSEPAPLSLQTAGCSGNTENTNEYHLRTENESKKFLGKLRAKSTKKKNVDDEVEPEAVNLPSIPLPITSLPSFDIPLPETKSQPTKKLKTNTEDNEFKFSSPIKFNETTDNLKSVSHFSFSEPINANKTKEISPWISFNSVSESKNSNSTPTMNFVWSGSNTAPRPKEKKIDEKPEELSSSMAAAVELKSGSVMDILGKNTETNIWECCDCFIKNNGNAEQCVACKAKKPHPSKKVTPSATNITASTTNSDTQFGAQFKMSNDKWECHCCLVRNPYSETKCLSCGGLKAEKKSTSQSNNSFNSVPVKSDLMEQFKPAAGSWECPGCMIRNPTNVIACPCCGASKPDLVKVTPKNNTSESKKPEEKNNTWANFTAAKNPKSWECPSCMVRNDAAATACVCCTTPCPGGKAPSTPASASGFGDKFKKPEGNWTCDTCMISNKNDAVKCIACETAKPGAMVNSKTEVNKGGLQFNIDMPKNTEQFQFGIPPNVDKKSDTTNGFTFGATTTSSSQNYTFGIPTEKSTASSGFTFANPKSTENDKVTNESNAEATKSSGITFGLPKIEENKSFSSGFSFGVPKVDKNNTDNTKIPVFNFGTPNTVVSTPKAEKTVSSEIKSTTPSYSFVAPGSVTTTAESNAVLSAPTTAAEAPYTFSVPKSSAASPLMSFGQNSSSNTSTSGSTSGFNFPTPKTVEDTQVSGEKKTISFGNTTTSVFGNNSTVTETKPTIPTFTGSGRDIEKSTPTFAAEKQIPAFGAFENKSGAAAAAASAVATAAASTFGSEKPIFNATTPSFGTAAVAPAPSTTTSLFGSPSPNIFGSNTSSFASPTSTPTQTNMFALAKPAETPANSTPGIFTFGAGSAQSTPATPGDAFTFTGGTPAATKQVFNFGNNAAASVVPVQPTATPTFGTPSFGSASSTPVPTFPFNSPKNDPPTFGQATAGAQIPNIFGSNASSPATSFSATPSSAGEFNFMSSSSAGTSSAGSGSSGYNFSATPGTPAGGYNYASASTTSQVAFDPNTRPSFNFTGGNAQLMFNATPAVQQSSSGRKIKKAVRRMGPRT